MREKPILRIPGPTPIPEHVNAAMAQPMIGHRSEAFTKLFLETAERLKPIFGTKEDVYIVSGSGTSALEACVVNAISPGDEVVVVVTGAFGDRFASICERFGAVTHRLDIPWGEACTKETLDAFLAKHSNIKAVIATYCETSTGVLNPINQLSESVKTNSDALFIVDGVSCIGGVPAKMDDWGVDMFVTGSQKALMLPPGLAFIGVSERAWHVIDKNEASSFYLDLQAYRESYKKGMTPYTPAVSLIFGLSEVCRLLEEEGLEQVYRRHECMKDMMRAAIKALGLTLLNSDADASPTVTSIAGNGDFAPDELRRVLNDTYNITCAGGQKELKGKIIRISHMGWCFPADVLNAITYLELALKRCDVNIALGSGVKAAQEVYSKYV